MPDVQVHYIGGRFDGLIELESAKWTTPGANEWRPKVDDQGIGDRYESCGPWSGGSRLSLYAITLTPCFVHDHAERFDAVADGSWPPGDRDGEEVT